MSLEDVSAGDTLRLQGDVYEVRDVDVQDIGLAEVVAIALQKDGDSYVLRQVGDNTPKLIPEDDSENEVVLPHDFIEVDSE